MIMMTEMTENLRNLTNELIDLLDIEITLLGNRVDLLTRLSPSMASRDIDATDAIMDEIEQTQAHQDKTDRALSFVRGQLARNLDLDKSDLKLSRLIEILPPVDSKSIQSRREKIIELAEALRTENLKAAVVLSECAHLNQLLMQSLTPRSSRVTTYGSGGKESWQSNAGMVDAKG